MKQRKLKFASLDDLKNNAKVILLVPQIARVTSVPGFKARPDLPSITYTYVLVHNDRLIHSQVLHLLNIVVNSRQ